MQNFYICKSCYRGHVYCSNGCRQLGYEARCIGPSKNESLGHIENGRIAVDRERIHHIVGCLGLRIEDFEKYLKAEVMRHEVIDQCRKKILDLPDEKLNLIKGIIDSLG